MYNVSMDLVKAIIEAQKKRGLSNTALASLLGVPLSSWSRIKSRERPPNLEFAARVMVRLPELALSVVDYMRDLGK